MAEELQQALNQEPVPPDPANNGGTEPEPPQAPGEPLDPNLYDDGGVPWKNRAMEAQRKLQEEADKRQYAEQLLNQQRMAQSPQAPQQPQQQDDPDERILSLAQSDPKAFIRELRTSITSDIRKEQFQQQKQRSINNAFAKYPDLRNQNSEFSRAVLAEVYDLQQAGFDPNQSPNLMEWAADKVAKRMGGNGNQTPPTPPTLPPSRLPNLGNTPLRPPAQKSVTPPPLRDTFKSGLDSVADEFSSEELQKVQDRLRNRDQRGDFQLGES